MNTLLKLAIGLLLALLVSETALARGGGGSNFMNGYGYQRRLQESRGYVAVQSNGPAARITTIKRRHRHAR